MAAMSAAQQSADLNMSISRPVNVSSTLALEEEKKRIIQHHATTYVCYRIACRFIVCRCSHGDLRLGPAAPVASGSAP
jgi:hypothetical protein